MGMSLTAKDLQKIQEQALARLEEEVVEPALASAEAHCRRAAEAGLDAVTIKLPERLSIALVDVYLSRLRGSGLQVEVDGSNGITISWAKP